MGQRYSRQREKIYQTVLDSGEHPTAEMVYDRLKPEMPQLSLGTVYRNLRQLVREGQLREVDGPVVRFDGKTALHSHARCVSCGAVIDLDEIAYDRALDRQVGHGWQIMEHTLVFNGLCPDCVKKTTSLKGEKTYGTEGQQDGGQSVDRVCR